MRIRKGDNVIIISGKDKGKSGKVLHAYPKSSTVLVDGVNVKKRHKRPAKSGQKGQIIDKMLPVHVSNTMLVDPKGGKPTRIKMKEVKGKKIRVTVKSGTELAS